MFVLTENDDAELTPAGALPEKGTHAAPNNSASKWSIAEDTETVKDNLTAGQELKAAQKRIKQLEGVNNYLREQMRITTDYTPDARDIRKAAKLFMAEYGGSWSQEELEGFANGSRRAYWAQILNEGGTIDSVSAIERSRIVEHIPTNSKPVQSYSLPASTIKISELFSNVNSKDGRLLKYIPDGFLNETQKKSKATALIEQKEYARKKIEHKMQKLSAAGCNAATANLKALERGTYIWMM